MYIFCFVPKWLLSLFPIPGRGGAGHRPNPFQVAPEASRIGCPFWRDHGPDTGTPDARPSRRRCGSAGRWPSPGARYGEGKWLLVAKHSNTATVPLLLQAHNDLLRTYEAKLTQFGIPVDELGFKPLDTTVGGQLLGQGPAGLVSTPS